MTCYNPICACYNKSEYEKTGKKTIHLVLHEEKKGDTKWLLNEKNYPHALYEYIYLPCRKCVGCRSDNAKMWSLRAYNEMKLHKDNCFITLTYNNDNVLVRKDPLCLASLRYKHFQNFIKRLRKRFPDDKFQYLVSGEYGLKDGRSHWHAIIFGFDFPDKELVYVSKGYNHYSSQILNECWSIYNKKENIYEPIGFTDLCNVDYDCCNYVAQYVLKKLPVDQKGVTVGSYLDSNGDLQNIELTDVCPPMVRSSRNPAIGLNYYKKYGEQAVELGYQGIVNKGEVKKIRTPEYYYKKFEQDNPVRFEQIKKCKEEKMKKYYINHPVDYDKLSLWSEAHLHRIKERIKGCLTKFIK